MNDQEKASEELAEKMFNAAMHKHRFAREDIEFCLTAPEELKPLVQIALDNGYYNLRFTEDQTLCAMYSYIFTVGIHIGLNEYGYEERYCYKSSDEALTAYKNWNGSGKPTGYTRAIKGN